jgi:hypothetical protein
MTKRSPPSGPSQEPVALTAEMASRFAKIALGHVMREYPNKLDHVLTGHGDLKGPKALHPVFYGSFDWHSCVHSYWLLATLLGSYPDMPEAHAIRALFTKSLTKPRIAAECAYLKGAMTGGFERPYGWAWLLMLQAELTRRETREGRALAKALQPLSAMFAARFQAYLPKATYPNRAGTHGNSAFALALAMEYAGTVGDAALAQLVRDTARRWYATDAHCQAWEPSGEDFLSPALCEAELMRRVLSPRAFRAWLQRFLPELQDREPKTLFAPARVSDRTDGRIVHLDGLNLSRAWCWRGIARSSPARDPIRAMALAASETHLHASLPYLAGHYMGEHWLASFALLALRPAVSGRAQAE